jgi:hypothetical protein
MRIVLNTLLLLLFLCNNATSQVDTTNSHNKPINPKSNKAILGFRSSINYNYKIIHYTPVFNLYLKKHNIYIGPEYNQILINPPIGDPIDKFEIYSWGLNFGYRYMFNSNYKKITGFFQFNYSIFKVDYKEYQLGPPGVSDRNKLFVENTGSLGINYNINKKITMFSGLGIGSFYGFFLILENVVPNIYFGLEYRLK